MVSLDSSYDEIIEEMKRLRVLYTLKQTLRYRTVRPDMHSESVGEHLFGMQVLVQYFLPLEDPEGKLDRVRINELILFHELGEIETGDIQFHLKTQEDYEREKLAAARVAAQLPGSLQKIAIERSIEFDAGETPEARFAIAIDKIEPIFEMFDEKVLPLFKAHNINRETAVGKKRIVAKPFPYMSKFLDAWEARAVSLDIFPE